MTLKTKKKAKMDVVLCSVGEKYVKGEDYNYNKEIGEIKIEGGLVKRFIKSMP